VEVASLRAHLDQVLEMPDQSTSKLPDRIAGTPSLPAAANGTTDLDDIEAEPVAPPITKKSRSAQRKRLALEVAGTPSEPAPLESPVEGLTEDGNAAEAGDPLERES
jgi:hypothetical protein